MKWRAEGKRGHGISRKTPSLDTDWSSPLGLLSSPLNHLFKSEMMDAAADEQQSELMTDLYSTLIISVAFTTGQADKISLSQNLQQWEFAGN